jgi:hypothetical protein
MSGDGGNPALPGIYLEDSYVLEIREQPTGITFSLEAVLTPDNPSYHAPKPGEQYCYARGELIFEDVSGIEWISRSSRIYTDADNEEDLGNIDSLREENGAHTVEGDWGKVRIETDTLPRFAISRDQGTDRPHPEPADAVT